MDALLFDPGTKKLSLVRKEVSEEIERDDLVVKVVYAGVCGSDLHIIDVRNHVL
jgi:threonine dehydrogenase-like Zn-dependent dehydrogenase